MQHRIPSLRLGRWQIDATVELAAVPMPFAEFLPASRPELIAAEASWLWPDCADESLRCGILGFHTWVLRDGRHTVLVDTCMGNDKDRGGHPAFHRLKTGWMQGLRALGVEPAAVDYVMCTHMHADHLGWNTRLDNGEWVPTFPKARYVFARREFEHRQRAWQADASTGHGVFADSVLPVMQRGQVLLVEGDHDLDGLLKLEPAPGHTPGNVVMHLAEPEGRAVLSGDVIHHPIQVKYPEWSAAFCEDPVMSADCRRRFVERHADSGTLILPAHFPAPAAGRILSAGDRWRYEFNGRAG
jgi:glyoxylase-like metal-dependent hydrolase (beta-lactamase superfamily II)